MLQNRLLQCLQCFDIQKKTFSMKFFNKIPFHNLKVDVLTRIKSHTCFTRNHRKKVLNRCNSTLEFFLVKYVCILIVSIDDIFSILIKNM